MRIGIRSRVALLAGAVHDERGVQNRLVTDLECRFRGYRFDLIWPANDCATILPSRTTCVSVAIS